MTDTVRRFLEELAELTGLDIDPDNPEPSLPHARRAGAR